MRFLAQRPGGGFVHENLPILDPDPVLDLSGPGSFSGVIAPDVGGMVAHDGHPVIDVWGTLIHLELDGLIRGSWIVDDLDYQGAEMRVYGRGIAGYLNGLIARVEWSRINYDPAQVVKDFWAHAQSYPDGDLGVTVVGSTPVRIGKPEEHVEFQSGDRDVEFDAGPYKVSELDATDIGREIDNLAADTPFDYTVESRWNADKTDVLHTVTVHYPAAGRRRTDLSFVQGENIISVVEPDDAGDDWASEVIGLGAGEGKGALKRSAGRVSHRLRRTAVLQAKDVQSASRLERMVRDELDALTGRLSVDQFVVRPHSNAPIGSWQLGDEIRVQARLPHVGEIDAWCRVVSWSLQGDGTAKLEVVTV